MDCSTSGATARTAGEVLVATDVNGPPIFSQCYSVTLSTCPGSTFDDAEIYLKSVRLHRWSPRLENGLEVSVRKVLSCPLPFGNCPPGDFCWQLTLNTPYEGDETDYKVAFEIVQTTSDRSLVGRVSHSCSGLGGCSATTSVPLPALPVRGFAVARFKLDSGNIGPQQIEVDVSNFNTLGGTLNSIMACAFNAGGANATCNTEAVYFAASDAEAQSAHRTLQEANGSPNYDKSTVSTWASANLSDGLDPAFRLCGMERFRLERKLWATAIPPPPNAHPQHVTWGIWAGAADNELRCGQRHSGTFIGGWYRFFGSCHPGPIQGSTCALPNPPQTYFWQPGITAQNSHALAQIPGYDAYLTILTTLLW